VPGDPEDYIHRIGRTARAATTGTAVTLVNKHDERKLTNIQSLIDKKIEEITLPADIGAIPEQKPHFDNDKRRGNRNNRKPQGNRSGAKGQSQGKKS
jgi:ATP-dependent RNA helicase RhlE